MRNTIHYAPTDIPTIFLGSWAKVIYKRLFRTAPTELNFPVEDALTLCGQVTSIKYYYCTIVDMIEDILKLIASFLYKLEQGFLSKVEGHSNNTWYFSDPFLELPLTLWVSLIVWIPSLL